MMSALVVIPPLPIVTVAEAKHHLRIDADVDDDNAYVEGLIAAAQGWIDGPAGWLGRSIGVQQLGATIIDGCRAVELRYGPVIEIAEVSFLGAGGEREVADTATYALHDQVMVIDADAPWAERPGRRVLYWAGCGRRDGGDPETWIAEAPAPIKHAILLLVGQWYMVRESVSVGANPVEVPFAVEALLQPYRVFR